MGEPTRLSQVLTAALADPSTLAAAMYEVRREQIATAADAELVIQVVRHMPLEPDKDRNVGSPLNDVASWLQGAPEETRDMLRDGALPELLRIFDAKMNDASNPPDRRTARELIFVLKVLALYQTPGGAEQLVTAARHPQMDSQYLWSVVLNVIGRGSHPWVDAIVSGLNDPLPANFAGIAFLDFVNRLAREQGLTPHPFDSTAGRARMAEWLADEENESYGHSATAALPFLSAEVREQLLPIALEHDSSLVRLEAAWAAAFTGNADGLQMLTEACLDPNQSLVAQSYLAELDESDRIPAQTQDAGFLALAEMCAWLAHPQEYGRAPTSIELVDSRTLVWPPTNDERPVWLFWYVYAGDTDSEPAVGHGMVGSVTFSLIGDTTADMDAEDVYALHCCWELDFNGDNRAPAERSVAAGRALLSPANGW